MKKIKCAFLIIVSFTTFATAQEKAGVFYPNRFGISYQKNVGIDLGFISYNSYKDKSYLRYYDISLGMESYISKPFMIAPKVNFDFGYGDWILIAGGTNIAYITDFSKSTLMFTPKIGISLMTFFRLYYGHNIMARNDVFPRFGKNLISLELNLAAFHDFKIGL